MMMIPDKTENTILKNPDNFAAIYARTSGDNDNNSIDAQIEKAKNVLSNENMLLYAVYIDKTSARTTPPPDRKGFGKLLEDAKAGCFKTIVAYRHDRIARNLLDWINLKAQLRKLQIKIKFSDSSEYTPDNSLQGDFIENLIIMTSQLEPENINERASNGRMQRRLEGIYNSAIYVPFGYKRMPKNSEGISYYSIKPLEAIFVQHAFCKANEMLGKSIEIKNIKQDFKNFIDSLININNQETLSKTLILYAEDAKKNLMLEPEKEKFLPKIIEAFHEYLNDGTIDSIKEDLKTIKKHLNNSENLITILGNSIYGGYLLINPNEKQQGVIIDGTIPKFNEISFKATKNVAPIISKEVFSKVYSYILMPKILKEDEPEYLFKGKFKCGSCGTYLSFTDGLLQCTHVGGKPKCKAYAKSSVIDAALDIILDDAFKDSREGFNYFYKTIEEKLIYLRKNLEKLRNEKMSLLKEYLSCKDERYIEVVQTKQDEINLMLNKISEYASELGNIHKLQELIEKFNRLAPEDRYPNTAVSKIKSLIINHIVSNHDIYNPIFNKLIKEIKVSTIGQKHDIICQFTINYGFDYYKPSEVHTYID